MGTSTPAQGANAFETNPLPLTSLGTVAGTIFDPNTQSFQRVDRLQGAKVFEPKRLVGQNTITNPSSGQALLANTASGTGTNTSSNGISTLATGSTANSSIDVKTINKARYQFGTQNLFRTSIGFADTGTANNVREFGLYVDSNNAFGFRLSGTTFSVFIKKAGSETVVNNGSFNGNGTQTSQSWTLDTNIHSFEILYFMSRVTFIIDMVAIHTFSRSNTSLISGMVGQAYWNNTNSGGSTSNVLLYNSGFAIFANSGVVNNPQYLNLNASSGATTVIKGGGGTLQNVMITSHGGSNSTLTLYDNTAASGTVIAVFDLSNTAGPGAYQFGINGLNFTNGLTAALAGTLTGLSVTVMWD